MSTEARRIMDNSPGNPTPVSPVASVQGRSIKLDLPWPPSVNHYWRHVVMRVGGKPMARTLLSTAGREYRSAVIAAKVEQHPGLPPLVGRLGIQIVAMPPDRRRRDLDNLPKAVLDALQFAHVFRDDSQIDDLHVKRGEVIQGGALVVFVEAKATPQGRLFK